MALHLYTLFHLNLSFSSIEVEQRAEVIDRCYWPLLRLVQGTGVSVGIEVSGYTLEEIARIDPSWIDELRSLSQSGLIELVGSGYVQMIGPLVPAPVNHWNQQLGLEVYQRVLGIRPALVLVNEQAYSASMVEHYLAAGYQGMIMEWENPSLNRSDWNSVWRYFPQQAKGLHGESIPLLWNMSMPFQQFQRYVHGEIALDAYLTYLNRHQGEGERLFPLYGNDAEIFDYRPGRYRSETARHDGEWQRMALLFAVLQKDERFRFVAPSQALSLCDQPEAGNLLELQTSRQPIPVKKQGKYNINRWAVTGRDDLYINSCCHKIALHLNRSKANSDQWRELCYLWSSDFRTHITEKRWSEYLHRLWCMLAECPEYNEPERSRQADDAGFDKYKIIWRNRLLTIDTESVRLVLNADRGLAVESFSLLADPDLSLLGTLRHGYFDQIDLGADFYSGHLVAEIPGDHKLTDLLPVDPTFECQGGSLIISAAIETSLGVLKKSILLPLRGEGFSLRYGFDWQELPLAALRLGHITLNPEAFNAAGLYYATHNGGQDKETFLIDKTPVNHLSQSGFLVSSSHGVGITGGEIEIGDDRRHLSITFDPGSSALTGHIQYQNVGERYFYRLTLSAREIDDTCSACRKVSSSVPQQIHLMIKVLSTVA